MLDLTAATPPQQLKRYARAAYERFNGRRIWQTALDRGLVQGDSGDFNTLLYAELWHARGFRQYRRRSCLRSYVTCLLPTAGFLQRRGWLIDPHCVCGEQDDQHHRLGHCFLTMDAVQLLSDVVGGRDAIDVGLNDLRIWQTNDTQRAGHHVL